MEPILVPLEAPDEIPPDKESQVTQDPRVAESNHSVDTFLSVKTEFATPEGKLYKWRQMREAKGWTEMRKGSSQVGLSRRFMTSGRQDRKRAAGAKTILPGVMGLGFQQIRAIPFGYRQWRLYLHYEEVLWHNSDAQPDFPPQSILISSLRPPSSPSADQLPLADLPGRLNHDMSSARSSASTWTARSASTKPANSLRP